MGAGNWPLILKIACTGDDLDDFVDAVIEANKVGISVSYNLSSVRRWSFGQSFFFATSLLATVGLHYTVCFLASIEISASDVTRSFSAMGSKESPIMNIF